MWLSIVEDQCAASENLMNSQQRSRVLRRPVPEALNAAVMLNISRGIHASELKMRT